MNSTATGAEALAYDAIVDDLRTGLALECGTCTGLICLDCAEGVAHEKCTRPCAECAGIHDATEEDSDDVAQLWRIEGLVTELAGLARLDAAIAALPAD